MRCHGCPQCERAARYATRDTSAAWWAATWGMARIVVLFAPLGISMLGRQRRLAWFVERDARITKKHLAAEARRREACALWIRTAVHA